MLHAADLSALNAVKEQMDGLKREVSLLSELSLSTHITR
jgi:hypothetical protein